MGNKARFWSTIVAIGGALGILAVTAGSLPACSSSDKDTVDRPCPPGQACSVNLTLIHTSDIHSRLFPYEQVITQVDSTLARGHAHRQSRRLIPTPQRATFLA